MSEPIEKNPPAKMSSNTEIIQADNQIVNFPNARQIAEYEAFLENYNSFVDRQLKKDVDYGVIPGVEKPSLLKPGAEKLEKLFFYRSETIEKDKVIEPGYTFVKYTFTTRVYNKQGQLVATCDGTCNSKEKKYRGYQKFGNEATDEEKKNGRLETKKSKKTGKEYTVYIIDKKDFYDIENTISKMAQKRSYVGAMLLATNSSGRFTQDVEDMGLDDHTAQTSSFTPQAPQMPKSERTQAIEKDWECPVHGQTVSLRPAGTTKQGKAYNAFHACNEKVEGKFCKERPEQVIQVEELPTIEIEQEILFDKPQEESSVDKARRILNAKVPPKMTKEDFENSNYIPNHEND